MTTLMMLCAESAERKLKDIGELLTNLTCALDQSACADQSAPGITGDSAFVLEIPRDKALAFEIPADGAFDLEIPGDGALAPESPTEGALALRISEDGALSLKISGRNEPALMILDDEVFALFPRDKSVSR